MNFNPRTRIEQPILRGRCWLKAAAAATGQETQGKVPVFLSGPVGNPTRRRECLCAGETLQAASLLNCPTNHGGSNTVVVGCCHNLQEETEMRIIQNCSATNHKALLYALLALLFDVTIRHEDDGEGSCHDKLFELGLPQLGLDPSRPIDNELIADAKVRLKARGINWDTCVAIVEQEIERREIEEEAKAIAEVGRRH